MKKTLCLSLFLMVFVMYSQKEAPEKIADLYKRLGAKTKGKFNSNNHKFYPKFSATYSYGLNFIGEDNKDLAQKANYSSLDFRGGYQTIGNNIYDQLWRYPEWGIGYYSAELFSDGILGNPNAVFLYIDVPFYKYNTHRKWNFSYSIGGGLSFNFRPNNPQDNPLNTLIGSYNNVYIDLAFYANYRINNSLNAKMGLSFVHFSNGASALPNTGLNLIGPKVIIQHNLVKEAPEIFERTDIPKWVPKQGLFIYQAIGSKQVIEGGENYLNTTTSLAYKYWWKYKGQWIGQLDLFYDGSNNSGLGDRDIVPANDRNRNSNFYSLGAFIGYEAIYNRWSFVSGWGRYLWRNYEYTNKNYQRFGIRYRIYDGLVIGTGLKARSFAADYIEWSIGYNIFKSKRSKK